MPRVGGAQTRSRIVLHAMRLFQRRGYYALSLDDIISGCGASRGGFYFHFKSKDELAGAALDMNTVMVPSIINVCFAGKSWADGIDTWLAGLVGRPENPLSVAAPMASLGLQLARGNPAFLSKVLWSIRSFERAIYAELENRGWRSEDASRRSATFSAFTEGHILRYVLSGDPRCISDLRRDLLPLIHPPGSALPEYLPVASAAAVKPSRPSEKKLKNPVDSVDEQSIILHLESGQSEDRSDARRCRLLECLADLFWRRGYYSTSLKDASQASGIPKGSLHVYFADKRQMAADVLDHYGSVGGALLDRAFACANWRQAVDVLMAALKFGALNQYVFGCPLANMGFEFVNTDDELAAKVVALFRATEERFARALVAYGRPPELAPAMAGTAVALCEGHLARMILYDGLDIADECREDLIELIEK